MTCLLIVDDDPDHRLIVRTQLEAEGYECEEAENGWNALSKLKTHQVALVLTDLYMPGMNGLELVHQLGTLATNIPVILMTSQSRAEMPRVADDFRRLKILSKPYNFRELLESVRRSLRQGESDEGEGCCHEYGYSYS